MLHISIKTTSLYGSFVRYLAIELNINCNRKIGAPDKPCGVGRADANPKLLLNDT